MTDFYTYLSMLLIAAPIVLGIGIFGAMWLRDEFYKYPFYENGDD